MSELKDKVDELAKGLGINLKFESDASLSDYKKGKVLTREELDAMPDGSIIWCVYYKRGNMNDRRVNGPYKITKDNGYGWICSDGSSWGLDICSDNLPESGELKRVEPEWSEYYHAVKAIG